MDIFAHGLWTYAIFHKKRYAKLAAFFGVMPDLLSFGILFIINIVVGNFNRGPPPISSIPSWLFSAYNLTHSLVMFVIVFLLIYFVTNKWLWALLGWPIHIIIDIPTHSIRFFPTPFLWPVSNVAVDGLSWGTPWFLVLNYSALLVVILVIAHNRTKKKMHTTFKK